VYSREGLTPVGATTAGKVTGTYNWISPTDNFLVYQDGTTVVRMRVSDNTTLNLATGLGGRSVSIAELGPRLYFTEFNNDGSGASNPQVHDGVTAIDNCFRGPLVFTSFTVTDPATTAGACTVGVHNFGFLFTSRSGYTGLPSPSNTGNPGGTFVPATFTVTAGANHGTLTVSVTLNTPSDAGPNSNLQLLMTRTDNPNIYYIVPTPFVTYSPAMPLPASSNGYTFTAVVSISDEDLANQTPALPFFDAVTLAPYSPNTVVPNISYVVTYGNRMVYGNGTRVFVSDPFNPQFITFDLNVVSNPQQKNVKFAFVLGSELYLTGDKWTGRVRDNGQSPSTWPAPFTVSDALGAPFQGCVGGGKADQTKWIASEFGLYLFDGHYSDKPVTYFWTDQWKRINWPFAYVIDITDDVINQKAYIAVPLDSNTECSHIFVIDYARGKSWDTVDISLDNYSFTTFGSVQAVKESNSRTLLWIGPIAGGQFSHIDPTVHTDLTTGVIHATWESGYVRQAGEEHSNMVRLGAQGIWANGSGTLRVTWFGVDRVLSFLPSLSAAGSVPGQIPLSTAPGLYYQVQGNLNPVENFTTRFEVNALGDWFQLSGFDSYTRPSVYSRG
jgi:hypothetical protein